MAESTGRDATTKDHRLSTVLPIGLDVWADPDQRKAFLNILADRLRRFAQEHDREIEGIPDLWILTPLGHPDGPFTKVRAPLDSDLPGELVDSMCRVTVCVEADTASRPVTASDREARLLSAARAFLQARGGVGIMERETFQGHFVADLADAVNAYLSYEGLVAQRSNAARV